MFRHAPELTAVVTIERASTIETLMLPPHGEYAYASADAPAEPHEFDAQLRLTSGSLNKVLPFTMQEPEEHRH